MTRKKLAMNHSLSKSSKLVLPGDTNNHNTLFGGLLMKYIDELAAIAARRHTQSDCVTAVNDGVHFHKPILNGHIVELEAYVGSVGRTSVEIFVKIMTENTLTKDFSIAATSFLTFVALDDQGRPKEVPEIYPETEEQNLIFEDREMRLKARIEKRKETTKMLERLEKFDSRTRS